MAELNNLLTQIKTNKDTYIIPKNLKKGVTAFGVTGDLEEMESENIYALTDTHIQHNAINLTPDFTKYYGKNFVAYIDGKNIVFDFTQSSGTVHTISLASIVNGDIIDYTVGYSVEDKYYIYICADNSVYTITCNITEDTAKLFDKYENTVENIDKYYVVANPYGNSFIIVCYRINDPDTNKIVYTNNKVVFFGKDSNKVIDVYANPLSYGTAFDPNDRLSMEQATLKCRFLGRNIIADLGYSKELTGLDKITRIGILKGNLFNWFNVDSYNTIIGTNDDATCLFRWQQTSYGTSYGMNIFRVKYYFSSSSINGTIERLSTDYLSVSGASGQQWQHTRYKILDNNRCVMLNNRWWPNSMKVVNFTKHSVSNNDDISYVDDADLYAEYFSRIDYSSILIKSDYTKIYNLYLDGTAKKVGLLLNKEDALFDIKDINYATSNQVLEGKYVAINNVIQGSMPNNGQLAYTPTKNQQTIPMGYTSGGTIAATTASVDSNIVASNIKSGVSILGVTGTLPNTKNIYSTNGYRIVELPAPHMPSNNIYDTIVAKIGNYYCEVTGKYGDSYATYITVYKEQNGVLTQIFDYNMSGAYDWNGIIGIENDCLYIHSYNRYSSYGSNFISKCNLLTGEYTRLSSVSSGSQTINYTLLNGIFFMNDNYKIYYYNMSSNTLVSGSSLKTYPTMSYNGNGNPYIFDIKEQTVDNVTTYNTDVYKIYNKNYNKLITLENIKIQGISYDDQFIFANGNIYKWNSDYSIGRLLKENVYTTSVKCVNDKYYFVDNNLCILNNNTYEFEVIEDLTGYSYYRGSCIYKTDFTNKKVFIVAFDDGSDIIGAEVDTNRFFIRKPEDEKGPITAAEYEQAETQISNLFGEGGNS